MLTTRCTAARTLELLEVPVPTPGPGDVVVKVRSCGICGSDLHFYSGGFPPPAVCPGHEISGEIAALGSEVRGFQLGDRVAVEPLVVCRECPCCRTGNYQLCRNLQVLGNMRDGGFAEALLTPAYTLFPLPDAVDFEVGALAEPLAVAVHAVRIGGVRLGDRVLVQGAGTIGLMGVAAAVAAGAADVWITARHPQQAAAARRLGATRIFAGDAAALDLAAAAGEQRIDVVLETVGGSADTLSEAVQVVGPGGSVVVLGIFTSLPAINPLLLVLHEVRIIGALTYGRHSGRADFDIALQLLAANPQRFHELITHRFPLVEIARGFETAANKRSGAIKVAIGG